MMFNRLLAAVCGLTTVTSVAAGQYFPLTKRAADERPVRGVNLGGWLVLEPWITPSIFEEAGAGAVDEHSLSQILGAGAQSRLSTHWNSWITQDDFSRIAASGLSHVRIPIGYWAVHPLDGDPYVQGQLEMMDKAIEWARNTGLKVIVDLHGAPGSQNGFDNSGRRGPIQWGTEKSLDETAQAIRILAERYARQSDVVSAIELLNEPFPQQGADTSSLQRFYALGRNIVDVSNPDTAIVISDAFQGVKHWNGFMNSESTFSNVILDTHSYHVFDKGLLSLSIDQHVGRACALGRAEVAQGDKWTITGEWSGALTDCAKYLNGRGIGARYDGSHPEGSNIGSCDRKNVGSESSLSEEDKYNMRRFIEAQLDAFEMGYGWFFWTWKTEGAPGWDMQQLLAEGLFPQPLGDRRYPGQCG